MRKEHDFCFETAVPILFAANQPAKILISVFIFVLIVLTAQEKSTLYHQHTDIGDHVLHAYRIIHIPDKE